jgi:hypothetical protein
LLNIAPNATNKKYYLKFLFNQFDCILISDHPILTGLNMPTQTKLNQAEEVKRIMTEKKISADDLARALKITTQTVYNMRRGATSNQLYDHAFIVLDNWEESK